ncbi:MAG TPA: helix-turn-helix domain-containing protein [Chloroflexota bacterium]|nr:helix-turn-helix domain-containing protein [Chloroflexota bacterium]
MLADDAHGSGEDMPKVLRAHRPSDVVEERWLRKLARSKRAPAEQVLRARTIVMSWDGDETATIATRLGCHPQTVRDRIARFNAEGARSIVAVSSGGRRPRLTESQRQRLVEMVERLAGGQPPDDDPAHGEHDVHSIRRPSKLSLDALVTAAHSVGIEIGRSQLRRVLLAAGLRWHPTYSWAAHAPSRKHAVTDPRDQESVRVGA